MPRIFGPYGLTWHTLPGSSEFPTTRWILVIAAGDAQGKEARSALVSLCEKNWYPLYAYLRRRRYPADQAQDLTQGLFMRVLERGIWIAPTGRRAGSGRFS